jgi:NAD(P)-dependent dehydrogenase (short-subunit alcohol dehydrogenase family)
MLTDKLNTREKLKMNGTVALVTGAGSGIGAAAAEAFAAAGARVALIGRRREPLEHTARAIADSGGQAQAFTADVSVAADVERVVNDVAERFGRLDFAFNNAGVQGAFVPVAEMDESVFDEVIAINMKGVWLCLKYELQTMLRAGTKGSIVNTSSFLSRAAVPGSSAYSASKAGLDAMVRAVALEAGPHGIRVNNINPGVIDTPMFAKTGAEIREPMQRHAALGRLGAPNDIAHAAVWLCSDQAGFITGQSISVDGGFTIPGPR